jgi:hypothetical protein
MKACEVFPVGLPTRIMGSPYMQNDFPSEDDNVPSSDFVESYLRKWMVTASRYNGSKLTFSKDKLVSISGTARQFSSIINEEYLAGLWNVGSMLPLQLLWKSTSRSSHFASKMPRPTVYQAPSWSCKHDQVSVLSFPQA